MHAVSRWLLMAVLVIAAAPALPTARAQEEKNRATIVVLCADDVTLLVDDKEVTTRSGTKREFTSPPLQPGKKFYYMITARWDPNNYTTFRRTRKVTVEAGKTAEVDLRKEDPKNPDKVFIRYVPTPQTVVDAMLKLGKVARGDVVYDLGCGDGRIPITAVTKFMAKKGVGIDLDPERIKDSKENAKIAGVEAKVEFRKEDVLTLKDLGQANVVTLYLADELNEKLRPELQKQLKPGSRIVSHRFLMGDWKPEKSETITVGGVPYQIHLWTIKKADAETPAKKEKEPEKKDKEKKEPAPDKETPRDKKDKEAPKDKKDKK